MENLQSIIETAIRQKKVTVRQMCKDIGITEQGYYRAIRANSMKMSTYSKIAEYLNIENKEMQKEQQMISNNDTSVDYWNGFIKELYNEIASLKMENWSLRKELGKFSSVSFQPALAS